MSVHFNSIAVAVAVAAGASRILASADKPDFANEICKNTPYPDFCLNTLYSDRRAKGAGLSEIAGIIGRLARENATDTSEYIASMIKSGHGGLEKCLANYTKAIDILTHTLNDLQSEIYSNLDSLSNALIVSVNACVKDLRLQGSGILAQRNKIMLKLGNMCSIASKLFEAQK